MEIILYKKDGRRLLIPKTFKIFGKGKIKSLITTILYFIMIKSLCVNLVGVFMFCLLFYSFFDGTQGWGRLVIFEIVLLWICNEVWYWGFSSISLLYGLVNTIKKSQIKIRKFYRISSFVLLILPPLLYLILYFVDILTNNGMQSLLGITFSQSLFLCSYVGIAIVWICTLFRTITPFALENIFLRTFEPEIFLENVSGMEHPVNISASIIFQVDNLLPSHRSLLKNSLAADEEILYTGRPVTSINNRYAKRDVTLGCLLLPVVAIMLTMSIQLFLEHELNFVCLMSGSLAGILVIIFGAVAYNLLKSPANWRRKLSKVSYAISNKRIFIFENNSEQSYRFTDNLNVLYEPLNESIGNIYLSKAGKISSVLNGIFGKNSVQVVDNKSSVFLSAPLGDLFHIQDGKKVLALIEEHRLRARP